MLIIRISSSLDLLVQACSFVFYYYYYFFFLSIPYIGFLYKCHTSAFNALIPCVIRRACMDIAKDWSVIGNGWLNTLYNQKKKTCDLLYAHSKDTDPETLFLRLPKCFPKWVYSETKACAWVMGLMFESLPGDQKKKQNLNKIIVKLWDCRSNIGMLLWNKIVIFSGEKRCCLSWFFSFFGNVFTAPFP